MLVFWPGIVALTVIATTIIIIIFLKKTESAKTPVVLVDAWAPREDWEDQCGHTDVLYTNGLTSDMDVNIEVIKTGDCNVSFNTSDAPAGARPKLDVKGPSPRRGGVALTLKAGIAITYTCAADEAPNPECKFRIRVTRI
jgi:hypothetical protein